MLFALVFSSFFLVSYGTKYIVPLATAGSANVLQPYQNYQPNGAQNIILPQSSRNLGGDGYIPGYAPVGSGYEYTNSFPDVVDQSRCLEGTQQREGLFVSTCQNGNFVFSGCIASSNTNNFGKQVEIPIGSQQAIGEHLLSCAQEGNNLVLKPIACVYQGKVHQPGSKYQISHLWYQCVAHPDGTIGARVGGCVGDKHGFVPNGGELMHKGVRSRCVIRDGGAFITSINQNQNYNQNLQNYGRRR